MRPWLGAAVCALVVARPMFPSESAAQGDGQVVVMLWVLLGAVWAGLGLAADWRAGRQAALTPTLSQREKGDFPSESTQPKWGWTEAALAVLIGWHSLAAVWAARHGSPRPAINMLWEWIALALCFFLARQLLVGARERRAAAALMISLAAALAAYGLYQYFVELPATRELYTTDPDRALREAGMWLEGPVQRELFRKRVESVEPLSTFALTNSLAGFLAPWLVAAIGIAAIGIADRCTGRFTWPAVALSAAVIGGCLLLTKSRGGYLAAALGVFLVGATWWMGRRGRKRTGWKPVVVTLGAALLGFVGILAARAVGGLDAEVLSEATKSLGYRVQYWESSLRMIADHPWFGVGPGNFQDVYPQYKLPEASEEVADPHNFLLEMGATAGVPAMLALVAVLGALGMTMLRGKVGTDASLGSEPDGPTVAPGKKGTGTSFRSEPVPFFPDAPGVVLAGGIAGFVLSLPLGMLSSAPPGIAVYLVGLPLFVGSVAAFWPWVQRGRFPAVLAAVGVIVLVANLLVSGGISFSGVSGSLWLLMALALNESEEGREGAEADRELSSRHTPSAERAPQRVPHVLSLVAMLIVVAACFLTGYRPVVSSQAAIRRAIWDPERREEHLRDAVAADPLAAEPREQLASQIFATWQVTRSPEAFREFEQIREEALRLAPRSADAWHHFAELYRTAYETTGERHCLERAVESLRRAVELYPNLASYRADLADALRAAGDETGFRQQTAEALRLDHLTPHEDKKLNAEQRKRLERTAGG